LLQTNGNAMGTACACVASDIFICNFAEKHFFNLSSTNNKETILSVFGYMVKTLLKIIYLFLTLFMKK
jgi:hypothetical protein